MQKMPKALVCALLEDNGRIFFLKKINHEKKETYEIPCFLHFSGDVSKQLSAEFLKQTGIDAEVLEIIIETRHNAGSRKKKHWVPCLVFKMRAKSMKAKISDEFSGYKWMSINEAKKLKLSRNCEWILYLDNP